MGGGFPMIDTQNFRLLLTHLGFQQDHNSVTPLWRYHFSAHNFELGVDFGKEEIIYPESHGFKVHQRQTCNFSAAENTVVLECVYRLLSKGYQPEHIELEPEWSLGHGGKSGRADILVRNQQGAALLIIECKTAGREFDKAWKDTLADGAQLISYVEQEKATQFICLYASEFDTKVDKENKVGELKISQRVISVKDNLQILQENATALSFQAATNAKERFKVWKETYQQEYTETGIFEDNIQPYQIGKNKYTLADDTKPLDAFNIKGAYHRFRTILRKHNVSRRENAFEVLVNLFVCKIVDESENPNDLKFYWKGIAYDNYFDLVDRLQSLYKTGMNQFLDQDIVYVSNDDIEKAFWPLYNERSAIKKEIKKLFRQLKFFKGLDFEFIKVFNQPYFDKNAKILIEVIQMWQNLRLTGSSQNQFLGDMFEYFLDNGIKQSEGQFFTPVPVCKFIVSALPLEQLIENNQEPLKAIDYACGSGHFLTEYASQLPELLQNIKQQNDIRSWYKQIYGIEKEDRLAKVAKVSAFMYGFNDIQILEADALVRHTDILEAAYNILVANPPFAVEDFLQTVPEEERERYTLLKSVSDLGNKNVQCFFLERAQQLLKPGGVLGIIVPSSILSNTDGMHVATREILLKYFDFVAITELGGNTFGKTGTNTVVLFLRRKAQRPEPAEHFLNRTLDFFESWGNELYRDNSDRYNDLNTVRSYCTHINLDFDAYQTLLTAVPNDTLLATELFQDYRRTFDESNNIKKWRASKEFIKKSPTEQNTELNARFLKYCREIEQKKLYYYLLAYHNPTPVLLIKGPSDNKAQQQFLGYEWSGAKGQEGIRYFGGDSAKDIITPLFDPKDRNNADKLSTLVRQNFEGSLLSIPVDLENYATQANLVDLLDFSSGGFFSIISLTPKNTLTLITKWPIFRLDDLMSIGRGASPRPIKNFITADLNGVSWIKIGDVATGEKFITKTEERITHEGAAQSRPVKSGDFILSNSMSFGRPYIVKIDGCIHDGWLLLSDFDSRLDKNYLYEILNYEDTQAQFQQQAGGSVVQNLNTSRVKSVKIPLPPLNIQQQIVAECETLDKEVEQAKNKIDGAYQATENILIGLEGKNTCRLTDVVKINPSKAEIKHFQDDTLISFVEMASVSEKGIINHKVDRSLKELRKGSYTYFAENDVIIAKITPCMENGKCALATGLTNGIAFGSTEFHVFRVTNAINSHFLFALLNRKMIRKTAEQHFTGSSGHRRVPAAFYENLQIPVPSIAEQQIVITEIKNLEHIIYKNQIIIDTAPAQKQAILKKYL